MIKYMILSITLVGCSIGPAPKVDTCLVNMSARQFECKNSSGTKFNISMNTTDKKNIEYLHNHISAPGHQIIDFFAWIKKAMAELQNDYYNKAK